MCACAQNIYYMALYAQSVSATKMLQQFSSSLGLKSIIRDSWQVCDQWGVEGTDGRGYIRGVTHLQCVSGFVYLAYLAYLAY